jgi:antitoxin component YwqK of YwqJK toxin-antitoxin module
MITKHIRYTLVCGFLAGLAALGTAAPPKSEKPNYDAALKAHIQALADVNSETRSAAAKRLRKILAKYPSGTVYLASKDGREAYWQEKVNRIDVGMMKTDVLKVLPKFAEAPEEMEIGSGNSHIVAYRLDYHWMVTISYRNPDKVIERPTLTNRAYRVHVAPPNNFTGTWITWHINGQKGYEIQFQNGQYDGEFTSYHDNGTKSYQQHYVNGVAHGRDTGWFPNGKVNYIAEYQYGKQHGTWTHWYASGNKQCETNYHNGKLHGREWRWHENGQPSAITDYQDDIKHGREASWDQHGVLNYDRTFRNGNLVK